MRKLITAAAVAALVAGCGANGVSKAPVRPNAAVKAAKSTPADAFLRITYVTANGLMGSSFIAPPNYYVRLRAETTANFAADLTWRWRAWGPIFGFDQNATWTTPSTEGTYTVDVEVRDRQGGWDWKTLYFQVKKDAKLAETDISEADKVLADGAAAERRKGGPVLPKPRDAK